MYVRGRFTIIALFDELRRRETKIQLRVVFSRERRRRIRIKKTIMAALRLSVIPAARGGERGQ